MWLLVAAAAVPDRAAAADSSAAANARQAERFYREVWFGQKYDAVDEIFAAEFINHEPRDPDPESRAKGRKLGRQMQKDLARQQAPGGTGRIDFQVAGGDYVATRWYWTTRIDGWWERFVSGKQAVEIPIVQIFRFDAEGRVAEVWNHRDDLGVQEQMRVSGLSYFEGVAFGAALTLLATRLLKRRTLWPGPQPPRADG